MADLNRTIIRARALRRSMSLPEGLLWQALRMRPDGYKFRRQHPIGPCIADFYCAAARLIIEVDGESHSMGTRPMLDARRDLWLASKELRVLRIPAQTVLRDIQTVLDAILAGCRG